MVIVAVIFCGHAMGQKAGTFRDKRDGKVYKTITIGDQTWMAEDLQYKDSTGNWCYKDDPANCNEYGRLYNVKAALESCPDGWHLPQTEEWEKLINYLGGEQIAGAKLKSTEKWRHSAITATNGSGFSALPAGYRNYGGVFGGRGTQGYWWSASKFDNGAWYFALNNKDNKINKYGSNHRLSGYCVRCVMGKN